MRIHYIANESAGSIPAVSTEGGGLVTRILFVDISISICMITIAVILLFE